MINYKELIFKFKDLLEADCDFQESLELARKNANEGKIWLIGGTVYKNLVNLTHGTNSKNKDYDFIIEKRVKESELFVPPRWKLEKTGLGQPRFIRNGLSVDIVALEEVHAIVNYSLEPKIQSYLESTPTNIQSVIYDTGSETLTGDLCLSAIDESIVRVNNLRGLLNYCEITNRNYADYLAKIANSLRFKLEMPAV